MPRVLYKIIYYIFGFVVGVMEMRCEKAYLLGGFLGDG
jgi:hypothetical protein